MKDAYVYYSVNKNILWTVYRIVCNVCWHTLFLKNEQVLLLKDTRLKYGVGICLIYLCEYEVSKKKMIW